MSTVHVFSRLRNLQTIIIGAISSAECVRNRRALTRAMFLQDDQRHVRPRTEEKRRKKARHAANAGNRWEKRSLAHSVGGASDRVFVEQAANRHQNHNPGKGKPHPMLPRRVTSAAGLPNAHSVAKEDQQQQAVIAKQDKLLAIVNKPSISKERDILEQLLNMYTTPDQLLPEIAACVWFKVKKIEKYLLRLSIRTWIPLHQTWDFMQTAFVCTGAQPQDGPPPRRLRRRTRANKGRGYNPAGAEFSQSTSVHRWLDSSIEEECRDTLIIHQNRVCFRRRWDPKALTEHLPSASCFQKNRGRAVSIVTRKTCATEEIWSTQLRNDESSSAQEMCIVGQTIMNFMAMFNGWSLRLMMADNIDVMSARA